MTQQPFNPTPIDPALWEQQRQQNKNEQRQRSLKVGGILGGIALAGIIGVGIGSAGNTAPTPQAVEDSDEYQELAEQLDAAESDLEDAQADLEDIAGDVPAREAAVEEAEAALAEREAAVASAEGEVSEREAAVGIVEETIAANTFDGDGIYVVGEDIQAGTYRSSGSSYCYWERLSGLSGDFDDIITNDTGEGPMVVTISPNDAAFSSTGCAEWTLSE